MIIDTGKGKLPIRYGWNALSEFGDLVGKTMDEILFLDPSKLKVSELITFIHVGLKEGARKKDEECLIKSELELADLIDDEVMIIRLALEAFAEFVHKAEKSTKVESKKK